MRNVKYRPVVGSPLYDRCNPAPTQWAGWGSVGGGMYKSFYSAGMATSGITSSMGQLYTAMTQPPGLRMLSAVPSQPVIGDTYRDSSTGESYTWDGFAWMHLGYRPPVVTSNHIPTNQAWILPNQLTVDVDLDDCQCDLINGVPAEVIDRNKRSTS